MNYIYKQCTIGTKTRKFTFCELYVGILCCFRTNTSLIEIIDFVSGNILQEIFRYRGATIEKTISKYLALRTNLEWFNDNKSTRLYLILSVFLPLSHSYMVHFK